MCVNDYRWHTCRKCGAQTVLHPDETECPICGALASAIDQAPRVIECSNGEGTAWELTGCFDEKRRVYTFVDLPGVELRLIGQEAVDILVAGKVVRSHVPPEVFGEWIASVYGR